MLQPITRLSESPSWAGSRQVSRFWRQRDNQSGVPHAPTVASWLPTGCVQPTDMSAWPTQDTASLFHFFNELLIRCEIKIFHKGLDMRFPLRSSEVLTVPGLFCCTVTMWQSYVGTTQDPFSPGCPPLLCFLKFPSYSPQSMELTTLDFTKLPHLQMGKLRPGQLASLHLLNDLPKATWLLSGRTDDGRFFLPKLTLSPKYSSASFTHRLQNNYRIFWICSANVVLFPSLHFPREERSHVTQQNGIFQARGTV